MCMAKWKKGFVYIWSYKTSGLHPRCKRLPCFVFGFKFYSFELTTLDGVEVGGCIAGVACNRMLEEIRYLLWSLFFLIIYSMDVVIFEENCSNAC